MTFSHAIYRCATNVCIKLYIIALSRQPKERGYHKFEDFSSLPGSGPATTLLAIALADAFR
jgi:hypothetical protein